MLPLEILKNCDFKWCLLVAFMDHTSRHADCSPRKILKIETSNGAPWQNLENKCLGMLPHEIFENCDFKWCLLVAFMDYIYRHAPPYHGNL